jgi:hypothetical protein
VQRRPDTPSSSSSSGGGDDAADGGSAGGAWIRGYQIRNVRWEGRLPNMDSRRDKRLPIELSRKEGRSCQV